jgi:hypothetical protein
MLKHTSDSSEGKIEDKEQELRLLKAAQALVSQILHDLISPYSALSTGLDIVSDHKGDLWKMMLLSKDQMGVLLSLFRAIFATGDLPVSETQRLLNQWMEDRFQLQNPIPDQMLILYPKVVLGLILWLTQQSVTRKGTLDIKMTSQTVVFLFHSAGFRQEPVQDLILQTGCQEPVPQQSYAYFVYLLLKEQNLKVQVRRQEKSLEVHIMSCT